MIIVTPETVYTDLISVKQWHERPESLKEASAYLLTCGEIFTVREIIKAGNKYVIFIKETEDKFVLKGSDILHVTHVDYLQLNPSPPKG